MIIHEHHILPRHSGGGDEESNLIKIPIKRHAMWHFAEWQLRGKKEDFIAWKALSGQMNAGEISEEKEALRIANMKGKKRTPEARKRMSESAKKRVYKGWRKPLTEEQKNNIRMGKRKAKWGDMTDEEIAAHKRHLGKLNMRKQRARKKAAK